MLLARGDRDVVKHGSTGLSCKHFKKRENPLFCAGQVFIRLPKRAEYPKQSNSTFAFPPPSNAWFASFGGFARIANVAKGIARSRGALPAVRRIPVVRCKGVEMSISDSSGQEHLVLPSTSFQGARP